MKNNIKGDISGGIVSGIIALPLALAYGVASGLGAAAGLYGAILVGLCVTIFGGTKTQISGPTSPITILIVGLVALYPSNLKFVFATVFLAGIFQILFGVLKVGKYIKFVPYPVISGFMSGIGSIIILLQINPLLGLSAVNNTTDAFLSLWQHFGLVNHHALLLGLLSLLIVFFTPKFIDKKVPSSLLALLFVTLVSVVFNFDVKTIGEIPQTFPVLKIAFININDVVKLLPMAFTLAILGSIDSLLTSLVADSLTKTKHDSDKELVGQGLGNIVASIFGVLPGSGAAMRTVVNIKSGGTTKFSGIVYSIFLILVVLLFAPFASKIPLAALAGILFKVGVNIFDYRLIKIIKYMPKSDTIVMIMVFLITVFYDLIFAVEVGIVASAILFSIKIAQHTNVDIEDIDNENIEFIDDKFSHQITKIKINGAFFFGTASKIVARVNDLLHSKCVVIDCSDLDTFDITAVFALEEMISSIKENKESVILILNNVRLKHKVLKLGLNKVISKSNIFTKEEPAMQRAYSLI